MTNGISTKKFINAALWSALNSYFFFVINFFGQIVLAKILFPSDYGLYAFSVGIVEICVMFLGFSNTAGFINSSGSVEDFNACFKLNVFSSLILCLIGIIGFAISDMMTRIITHGLFFLLICVTQSLLLFAYVFMAPLQKSLNFKTVFLYSGICSSTSLIFGILFAKMHFSYWSLALRDVLNNLFLLLIAMKLCPLRVNIRFLKSNSLKQISFGLKMSISRAMELLYYRFSDVLIKFSSGKIILGNFYQARAISYYPIKLLEPLTHQVLFSFFSNFKNDPAMIVNRLNWINTIIVRLFLPISLFTILYGKSMFIFVYGQKWALAGNYFEYFSFWMPIASLFAAFTSAAYSLEKQWIASIAYLLASSVFIFGMIFFHQVTVSPPLFFTIGLTIGYAFSLMALKKIEPSLKITEVFLPPILVVFFPILTYFLSSRLISIIVFILLYGLMLLYEKSKAMLIWNKVFTREPAV